MSMIHIRTKEESLELFARCWQNKKPVSATVMSSLRRLIAGTENLGKTRREESGKIDTKSFSRFACGDASIFSRKKMVEGEPCKVSLLVDCSGSMSGANMESAQQVVVQLGWLLDACKATWSCTGYNSFDADFFLDQDERCDIEVPETDFIKVKSFLQSTRSAAANIGAFQELCGGTTPDFAAPVLFMKEFSKETGGRKVLILITDGQSLGEIEAKEISRIADSLHINLVVIGVEQSNKFADNFNGEAIVINSLNDMTSKVFSHLLNRVSSKHKVEV